MSVRVRNLILTVLALGSACYALSVGRSDYAMAALSFASGLWMHSGRRPSGGDPGLAVVVPVVCLATLLGACSGQSGGFLYEIGARFSTEKPAARQPIYLDYSAKGGPGYGVQAGLLADVVEWKTAAAPTCTSGRACMYALNTDGLLYTYDANGLTLKLHAAQSFRTSSSCSGLSSPVVGDVCYDTTSGVHRFYDASGWETVPEDDLVVHLAGSETITGTKTFSGGILASGSTAINWGGSTGDFALSTGDVSWAGAAGKKVTLTQGVAITGSPYVLKLVGGAHTTLTASTEAPDAYFNFARTVQFATGAITNQRAFYVTAPTYGFVGASTVTTAATVAISGAPVAGTNATLTNSYALLVESGATKLTGTTTLSDNVTLATTKTLTVGSNTLIGAVADKLNAAYLAIASQATGDLLVADSASTFARKAIGSTGQVLAVASGTAAWTTVPHSTISGGGTGALGAATVYLTAPGQTASATERFLTLATRATNSRNLYCFVGTAPGGADTVVVTARENASDMTLTCTITGAATTCNDTSNSFASVAGDRLSIKAVSSAGTAADITCTFEMTVG